MFSLPGLCAPGSSFRPYCRLSARAPRPLCPGVCTAAPVPSSMGKRSALPSACEKGAAPRFIANGGGAVPRQGFKLNIVSYNVLLSARNKGQARRLPVKGCGAMLPNASSRTLVAALS